MKIHIKGERQAYGLSVWVNDEPLMPDRSLALCNHSPDGFECGYLGSGPAQLALAILLAAGVEDASAVRLHQRFKFAFVQHWHAPFEATIDVAEWIARSTGGS
jgi:hypothetical protein